MLFETSQKVQDCRCAKFLINLIFVLAHSGFSSLFDRSKLFSMSLDQVEVPDQKNICPDLPRPNMFMSRTPRTELTCYFCAFKNICAFFVCSKVLCLELRVFKITNDQTLVGSKPKFMRTEFENLFVHFQTILLSKTTMARLSCVQKCVYPNFRAFMSWHITSFIHISFTQRFYNAFILSI